jgi:hypothetical protein
LVPHHFDSSATSFASLRLKQACSGLIAVAMIVLWALTVYAQQGPFADMAGSWSGSGNIKLASGSRDRIQCRATYDVPADGQGLQLALRCASDSYNFDFRGNAIYSDGSITGNWSETTRNTAGQFTGRAAGNHFDVRIEGQTFAALLSMTTSGDRQSVTIESPGSQISDVMIVLRRR